MLISAKKQLYMPDVILRHPKEKYVYFERYFAIKLSFKFLGNFLPSGKAKHLKFLPQEMKGEETLSIQYFRALKIKLLC